MTKATGIIEFTIRVPGQRHAKKTGWSMKCWESSLLFKAFMSRIYLTSVILSVIYYGMKSDKPPIYNLNNLARKTRLSRRTIRYYIQRGLLPRPEGGGRGYYYTDDHQRRLDLIQKWSRQGVPLEKIKEHLSEERTSKIAEKAKPAKIITDEELAEIESVDISEEMRQAIKDVAQEMGVSEDSVKEAIGYEEKAEQPPMEPKSLLEELYTPSAKKNGEPPKVFQVPSATKITQRTRIHIGPDIELSFPPGTLSREDQESIAQFISSRLKIK